MMNGFGGASGGLDNMLLSTAGMPLFSLEVNQALLKQDDDLLRQMFSDVFRHHHPQLSNKVDVIFTLAQASQIFLPCSHRPRFSLALFFSLQSLGQ